MTAAVSAPEAPPAGPWLLIDLAGHAYALPVPQLREVLRGPVADPVPGGPEGLLGIIHVRGEVLPVLDLRVPLALPPVGTDVPGTLVVVEAGEESFALRVDAVADVVKVRGEALEPRAVGPHPTALCGFARLPQGLIQLIDPRRLLPEAPRAV